jgi:hypothetical protein
MTVPDLQLAPVPDPNGWTSKLLVAALVMTAIGAAVYFLNPRKTADVKVEKVAIFAPHTVFEEAPGDGHVMGTPAQFEDDVYVVATVAITDRLRLPVSFDSTSASMTNSSGEMLNATVVSTIDLPRLEQTFPQVTSLVSEAGVPPLRPDDVIAPGTTRTGTVVLLFPQINQQAWNSRQSAKLTLVLGHGAAPITVNLP